MIWNAWDEEVPWAAAVMDIVHAHTAGAPQDTFPNLVSGGREILSGRILSTSYIAALAPAGRERVVREVLEIVDSSPATAEAETLVMPYTTHVLWCARR